MIDILDIGVQLIDVIAMFMGFLKELTKVKKMKKSKSK